MGVKAENYMQEIHLEVLQSSCIPPTTLLVRLLYIFLPTLSLEADSKWCLSSKTIIKVFLTVFMNSLCENILCYLRLFALSFRSWIGDEDFTWLWELLYVNLIQICKNLTNKKNLPSDASLFKRTCCVFICNGGPENFFQIFLNFQRTLTTNHDLKFFS